MLNRRQAVASTLALVAPGMARSQTRTGVRRVCVLMSTTKDDPDTAPRVAVLQGAMRELGWRAGENIEFVYAYAPASLVEINDTARALVELRPDVLMGVTVPLVRALRRESGDAPLIFVQVTDPVGLGLSDSLAKPGRNMSGFTNFEGSMGGKWLQYLKMMRPDILEVDLLFNPTTSGGAKLFINSIRDASAPLGLQISEAHCTTPEDITRNVTRLGGRRQHGILVISDIFTTQNRKLIIGLASEHKVPTVYPFKYFALDGGLLAYGVDVLDLFRSSTKYIDRVLRGEAAGDLPIQQPTKFELAINLRAARALDIDVPSALMAQADEVID